MKTTRETKDTRLDTNALLIVVVMFILLGTGTYLFIKSKITIPADQRIVSLDKKTWKVFADEKLGITFKYPSEWVMDQYPQTDRAEVALKDGEEKDGKIVKLEITRGLYNDPQSENTLTYEEFLEQRGLSKITQEEAKLASFTSEEIKVGRFKGMRYAYKPTGFSYFVTEIHLAETPSSENIITITYRHNEKENTTDGKLPVTLDRILSTFAISSQ